MTDSLFHADEYNAISPHGIKKYILLGIYDLIYLIAKYNRCFLILVYILCSLPNDTLIFYRRCSRATDLIEFYSYHRRDNSCNRSFTASWGPL